MNTTTRSLFVLAALTACNGGAVQEVDDPQLEASAKSAGEQSAAIGDLSADAEEGEITAAVQTLGGSFQSMQSQHQASYASSRLTPAAAADLLSKAAPGEVLWDGTTLSMNWSIDESSISLVYLVELTYGASGDGYVIDGTYDLEYDASAAGSGITYDLSVTYEGLTTDGSGCPIGGAIDMTYDYSVQVAGLDVPGVPGASATDLNGRVRVEYNACDDQTVLASN